jgi:predicted XRE-type DNA-binding protein
MTLATRRFAFEDEVKILDLAKRGGAEFSIAGHQAIEKGLTMADLLNAILAARKLTQAEAARLLGVNQPKVSALMGYKLEGFSVDRPD